MSESHDPCLVTRRGPDHTRIDLVGGNVWTVGRGKRNHIDLKDELVSRNHAMIQRTGNEFLLVEFGSRNGSFVNNRRVTMPVRLKDQDCVVFGAQEFTFSAGAAARSPENSPDEPKALEAKSVLLASQQITVLVVDLHGFTTLAERLDEAKLAQLIGSWIQQAGEILHGRRSWDQKYLSDAIVAVWVHEQETPDRTVLPQVFSALSQLIEVTAHLQSSYGLSEP
ncbi:MAG: FHA domain-containing protein, partial [bacterium]|nr:FHA domain-containing protein [bacterium]